MTTSMRMAASLSRQKEEKRAEDFGEFSGENRMT